MRILFQKPYEHYKTTVMVVWSKKAEKHEANDTCRGIVVVKKALVMLLEV